MVTSLSFAFLVAVSLFSRVSLGAIGPTADLRISNAVLSPDGFSRSATVINGVVDRTIITAQKGDTFRLNVTNALNDSTQYQTTSIHWHGFFQTGSNWADGATWVTQCPISKNRSFLYTFRAPNAGTYWYHSHLATQYCDGARGAIVVQDPNDVYRRDYDVDDDSTVLTLSDWYHTVSRSAGAVPIPDATLINGRGRSTAGLTNPLAVVSVERGKRYRFRLINIGCDPNYTFQIDQHTFTIIEVDSVTHQALLVDQIQIFVGQRYSFILNATQPVGNYWIRAQPNIGANTGFDNGRNMAILRYLGAPVAEPTTSQTIAVKPLIETNLHPFPNAQSPGPGPVPGSPVAGGVTKAFNLVPGFANGLFSINGVTFVPPTVPVLLQILSGAQNPQSLLPTGSVFEINQNDTVELTIPGGGIGSPHPIHLHGHNFHVIRSAGSTTYNYNNPVIRDVVSAGAAGDNVTIRFRVDNPGPWILHCHIDWHLHAGLAGVFAEDVRGTSFANPVPVAWQDLCPIYSVQKPEDL